MSGGFIDVGFDAALYTDEYLWFRIALRNKDVLSTKIRLWDFRKHDIHLGSGINLLKFSNNIHVYVNLLFNLAEAHQLDGDLKHVIADKYPKKLIIQRIQLESRRARERSYIKYIQFLFKNFPLLIKHIRSLKD